jgi:hypothetical protein
MNGLSAYSRPRFQLFLTLSLQARYQLFEAQVSSVTDVVGVNTTPLCMTRSHVITL